MKNSIYLLVAVMFISGCASILSGKSQTITVQSNPTDARCELLRAGQIIATVEHTPGVVKINKTKDDISVICKKQGYADSTQNAHSGNDGYTLGNIILSGGIGWAVDSAVGADNQYPDQVMVNLSAPTPLAEGDSSSETIVSQLEGLKKLRQDGVLTESEYNKKRQELVKKL